MWELTEQRPMDGKIHLLYSRCSIFRKIWNNPLEIWTYQNSAIFTLKTILLQHSLQEPDNLLSATSPWQHSALNTQHVSDNCISVYLAEGTYCWYSCQTYSVLSLISAPAVNRNWQIQRGGGFTGSLGVFEGLGNSLGFEITSEERRQSPSPHLSPPSDLNSRESNRMHQWYRHTSAPHCFPRCTIPTEHTWQIHCCVYTLHNETPFSPAFPSHHFSTSSIFHLFILNSLLALVNLTVFLTCLNPQWSDLRIRQNRFINPTSRFCNFCSVLIHPAGLQFSMSQ